MPTATEAPAAARQRVMVMGSTSQPYFTVGGLPRYRGEILPREGANVQMMLEQGALALVSREAAKEVVKCECGREFADEAARDAHVERGHDREPTPRFDSVIAVEEPDLECPPSAHADLAEEGDGRMVRMWHPKTKIGIPRRGRDGSVAGEDR